MSIPPIHLYDTRRRAVVPFVPLVEGTVGIYTCGPTVYAPQTLGNMRSQLTPDVLRRLLLAAGYEVTFVTNITDVGHLVSDADEGDDKVEAAAARTGLTAAEITGRFTDQWARDRRRLGMLEPDVRPAATAHIAEQIAMIRTLEEQGRTYRTEDGLYFDTATFPGYADFAGLDLDEQTATGRVAHAEEKRHPADFALWKFSPTDQQRLQEWDSPWGTGFPGWHIECSAMSTKYLGERFDIHTGGVDHIRVHHTNEVAQTECALGVHPWVSYWVHTEFMNMSGRKVSKSAGDVLLVDTLVEEGLEPLAFRYFLLQAHYRQQMDFSLEAVRSAGTALRRLTQHAVTARDEAGGRTDAADPARTTRHRDAFWGALADDLNTSRALAVASAVAKDPALTAADRWSLLADFDRVLGFGFAEAADPEAAPGEAMDPEVATLLEQRQTARAAKDFGTADAIRDRLAAQGYEIIDTPDGPVARPR